MSRKKRDSRNSRAKPVPRTDGGPRRRRLRLAVAVGLLGLLFWQRDGWWPPLCRTFAHRAVQARDFEKASYWLDAVNWLASEDAETALLRARVLRKLGRMDEVGQALRVAQALKAPVERLEHEQWLALAQSGQMKQAGPQLSRLLTRPGDDGEEICEAFALGYMRNLNFVAAHRIVDAWMADWPNSPWPYLQRGRIALAADDFQMAEENLRRACELAPGNLECRLELARTLQATNRPQEAIPLLEACRKDSRFRTVATLQLALCLKVTGAMSDVVPLLQEVLRDSPGHAEALRELGRTQLEIGETEAAVETLQAALAAAPRDDEVHYILAQALQAAGRPDEALPHFEYTQQARRALRELSSLRDTLHRNPGDLAALVRTGEIMLMYGEVEQGVLRLLAALDREPQNQRARRLLANHYAERAGKEPGFAKLADEHRRWLTQREDESEEGAEQGNAK
jgi:tetratricopeptide (TPR) repeat protein